MTHRPHPLHYLAALVTAAVAAVVLGLAAVVITVGKGAAWPIRRLRRACRA